MFMSTLLAKVERMNRPKKTAPTTTGFLRCSVKGTLYATYALA